MKGEAGGISTLTARGEDGVLFTAGRRELKKIPHSQQEGGREGRGDISSNSNKRKGRESY